jgi:hypothetical protein
MDTLEIGSLRVEVKPNGLVKLTITALKNGEPVSFISRNDLQRALYWIDNQGEEEEEDLL